MGLPLSVFSRKELAMVLAKGRGPVMPQLAAWLAAGQLQPVVDRTFPLADTAAAHRYSEQATPPA